MSWNAVLSLLVRRIARHSSPRSGQKAAEFAGDVCVPSQSGRMAKDRLPSGLWARMGAWHKEQKMARQFRVIIEKHPDGYVAYPLGLKGVVVGEGDTCEQALEDVKSAIAFHVETFGPEVLEVKSNVRGIP
jgi:predicted RNase H-like HicB family nuclease